MAASLAPDQRIVYAVGLIVLASQEIERNLKFQLPFMNSDDPAFASIFARQAKLAKKSLGDLAGQFVASASSDGGTLESFMKGIVEERNQIVHHFQERFGDLLEQGRFEEVLESLRDHHARAMELVRVLREMSLAIAEAMRDTTFAGTPEYGEFAAICEKARASLAK
jgi:hypothetical protein